MPTIIDEHKVGIDRLSESFDKLTDAEKEQIAALMKADEWTKKNAVAVRQLSDLYAKEAQMVEKLNKLSILAGSERKKANHDLQTLRKNIGEIVTAKRAEASAYEKATSAMRGTLMSNQNMSRSYQGMSGALGMLSRHTTGFIGVLGLYKFGIKEALDASMDYSRSMFELSKSQAVAGNNVDNLRSKLKTMNSTLVISRQTFASLANTMSRGLMGKSLNVGEIQKFASVLEKRVGYNLDEIKSKSEKLIAINQKMPSMYYDIVKAMEAANAVDMGKATAEQMRHLEHMKKTMPTMGMRLGMDQSEIKDILGLMRPMTEEQKKSAEVEKARTQIVEEFRDVMLDIGTRCLPILKGLSDALIGISDVTSYVTKDLKTMIATVGGIAMVMPVVSKLGIAIAGLPLITTTGSVNALGKAMTVATLGGARGFATLGAAIKGALGPIGALLLTYQAIVMAKDMEKDENAKMKALQEEFEYEKKTLAILREKGKEKGLDTDQLYRQVKVGMASPDQEMAPDIKEALDNLKQVIDGSKELSAVFEENGKLLHEMKGPIEVAQLEYGELLTQVAKENELIGQTSDALSEKAKILAEYGIMDRESMEAANKLLDKRVTNTKKALVASLQLAASMTGVELDIDINADMGTLKKEANTRLAELSKSIGNLQAQQSLATTDSERERLGAEIVAHMNAQYNVSIQSLAITKDMTSSLEKQREITMSNLGMIEDYNSGYQNLLSLQGEIISAAQFGLGPSLENMQDQVAAANELKNAYVAADSELRQQAKLKGNISDQEMEQLLALKDQVSIRKMAQELTSKSGGDEQSLIKYAKDHLDLKTKELQQQKKILDITKEIREGYLDAIREMSLGAGEFSKIIGTQTMGATQLMNIVEKVTGKPILNTLKMGGQTSNTGPRSTPIGRYGANGLQFDRSNEMERNKDIYGYDEWNTKFWGNLGKQGEAPSVGSALSDQSEPTINAMRAADMEGAVAGGVGGVETRLDAIRDQFSGLTSAILAGASNLHNQGTFKDGSSNGLNATAQEQLNAAMNGSGDPMAKLREAVGFGGGRSGGGSGGSGVGDYRSQSPSLDKFVEQMNSGVGVGAALKYAETAAQYGDVIARGDQLADEILGDGGVSHRNMFLTTGSQISHVKMKDGSRVVLNPDDKVTAMTPQEKEESSRKKPKSKTRMAFETSKGGLGAAEIAKKAKYGFDVATEFLQNNPVHALYNKVREGDTLVGLADAGKSASKVAEKTAKAIKASDVIEEMAKLKKLVISSTRGVSQSIGGSVGPTIKMADSLLNRNAILNSANPEILKSAEATQNMHRMLKQATKVTPPPPKWVPPKVPFSSLSPTAKALKVARGLSKKLAPVDAALQIYGAGRSAIDEDYRKETVRQVMEDRSNIFSRGLYGAMNAGRSVGGLAHSAIGLFRDKKTERDSEADAKEAELNVERMKAKMEQDERVGKGEANMEELRQMRKLEKADRGSKMNPDYKMLDISTLPEPSRFGMSDGEKSEFIANWDDKMSRQRKNEDKEYIKLKTIATARGEMMSGRLDKNYISQDDAMKKYGMAGRQSQEQAIAGMKISGSGFNTSSPYSQRGFSQQGFSISPYNISLSGRYPSKRRSGDELSGSSFGNQLLSSSFGTTLHDFSSDRIAGVIGKSGSVARVDNNDFVSGIKKEKLEKMTHQGFGSAKDGGMAKINITLGDGLKGNVTEISRALAEISSAS